MGEIDNSAANEFRTCPLLYQEGRLAEGTGLEQQPYGNEVTPLDLGSRIHELQEEYYRELQGKPRDPYPESANPALEIEAQIIMAAYKAKYPVEEFEIVDVERTFKVALPRYCSECYNLYQGPFKGGKFAEAANHECEPFLYCVHCNQLTLFNSHVYTGKIDVAFRVDGILNIMDHKSEKRRSNSNRPQKWAARDQASLYLWAAQHIYNEPIGNFYVNILKRPSEKFQEPPIFPDRQKLERTPQQIETAVRDLVFIADEIERYKKIFGNGVWPSNREECDNGFYQCEFYLPHTYGWSADIREHKYQAKTPYLELAGVPIIQP